MRANLRSKAGVDRKTATAEPTEAPTKSASPRQPETTHQSSLEDAIDEMERSGSTDDVFKYVTGFIMTQMTAKAGIKKHGEVAVTALYQEFLQ